MGIYRLTTRLLHKGDRKTFLARDEPTDANPGPYAAFIDGPSLAHHVYYRFLREHDHDNAAQDISYAALNQALLASLQELESVGFTM